jgi:hypothetical protein
MLFLVISVAVATLLVVGDDRTRRDAALSLHSVGVRMLAFLNGRDPAVYFPDEHGGFLYIEAPQIFTRERLVNDRYRQSTWLEAELAASESEAVADLLGQPSARSERVSSLAVHLGEAAAAGTPEAAAAAAEADLTLEARLLFKQKLALREDIRAQLMDSQLDDVHDLDGNTLYRMTFEATTVPYSHARRYPGSAVFVITVDKGDDNEEDKLELLRDWQYEIQNYVSNITQYKTENLMNSDSAGSRRTQESIAFLKFLEERIRVRSGNNLSTSIYRKLEDLNRNMSRLVAAEQNPSCTDISFKHLNLDADQWKQYAISSKYDYETSDPELACGLRFVSTEVTLVIALSFFDGENKKIREWPPECFSSWESWRHSQVVQRKICPPMAR